LRRYSVPPIFSPDIFHLAPAPHPPYRWILLGPARSGTGLHIDPLWTNAWVALVAGKKRWLLFPPKTPPALLGVEPGKPQVNSSIWFQDNYDRVTSEDWPEEFRPHHVLQSPGEIVFVPNGWFHLVLNLEESVAVTHNYACEDGPFERMYDDVVENEAEFAGRWREALKEKRPDLEERLRKWEREKEERGAGAEEATYSSALGHKTNV
jgi:histone arginine demethylase JMJD6